MNVNSSVGHARDALTEIVAIKAGIYLAPSELQSILTDVPDELSGHLFPSDLPRQLRAGGSSDWVRYRPEHLEDFAVKIMYTIGAIPDDRSGLDLLAQFARDNPDLVASIPDEPFEDGFPDFFPPPIQRWMWFCEFIRSSVDERDVPAEFADLIRNYQQRSIADIFLNRSQTRSWDGVADLKSLFEPAAIAGTVRANHRSEPLLDQRFIDFLQARPHELDRIHWRQFELLVGEWFRREKYEVEVTSPTRDGGIDVKAIKESGNGPELLIVQAKRLSGSREVQIEAVKALWADVEELAATRGVVATTTALARGAKEYCEARQYRLTPAERSTVESWLRSMSRFPH